MDQSKFWRPEVSADLRRPAQIASHFSGIRLRKLVSDAVRDTVERILEEIVLPHNQEISETVKEDVVKFLETCKKKRKG